MTATQGPILLHRFVAVVNKEVITWSELYKAMEFEAATQIKNLGAEERRKVVKQSETSFIESLIDARPQLQEAQKLGLESSQNEIKDTLKKLHHNYPFYFLEY